MPFDAQEIEFLKELSSSEMSVMQQGFTELKQAIGNIQPGGSIAKPCEPGCLQLCFNCQTGHSLVTVAEKK